MLTRRPRALTSSTSPHAFVRALHSSTRSFSLPDYYGVLEVPVTASPSDIKKQFYKLSKANHPDLHPSDPTSSQRFVKISEAYAILGSEEKRARYDRDHISRRQSSRRSPSSSHGRDHDGDAAYPRGSFSSASTPVGSRPASGLSRRRTQFRGPPPSFYRSGGWGEHAEKREGHARQASHAHGHSHASETRNESSSHDPGSSNPSSTSAPGMGPAGFTTGHDHDVPHFDQDGHLRTHSEIERARQATRRKSGSGRVSADDYGVENSQLFNSILVSGILAVAVSIAAALSSFGKTPIKKQREER